MTFLWISGWNIKRWSNLGHRKASLRVCQQNHYNEKQKITISRNICKDYLHPVMESRQYWLIPVLRKVVHLDHCKGKVKFIIGKLIINKGMYTVDNIESLPQDLNITKVSEKSDGYTLVYFGQLRPFQNSIGKFSRLTMLCMHSVKIHTKNQCYNMW